MSSSSTPKVRPPAATPANAPGSMIDRLRRSQMRQYARSEKKSMNSKSGSSTAAACTGEITSDISGTAMMPRPPPTPALEKPTMTTAGSATA